MFAAYKLEPNDELISHAQHAVHETIRLIHGVSPIFGPAVIKDTFHVVDDISGVILLSQGNTMSGSMLLCFSKDTIFEIAGKIYKKKFTELDKSVAGCVAEICNMTFGVLKKHLNERGFQFKMSIPSVIHGESHNLTSHTVDTVIEIPAKVGKHGFRIIIALTKEV